MSGPKFFAFGYGTTAAVLGARLLARGWAVAGTCRSKEQTQTPKGGAVKMHIFGAGHPLPTEALAGTTHLLISIPPERGDKDHILESMAATIERHHETLEWIGYLSTTGVYGDRQGDWVTERDALCPTSDRGRRRVAAERAWFDLGTLWGVPVQSFRLAGIYGPGRNQIVSLRAGRARRLVKPGHVFSRIHVDDIATVLEASIARPRAGAAYNVCDDEAAPPQDVVAFAADLAGLDVPPEIPFEEADLTPMARSFYEESKRVSNSLIKRELDVTLRYPTFREGLRALLKSGA